MLSKLFERSYCSYFLNKNIQLSLTNPCDAKACQKVLQFGVTASYRQTNNLFEVMEIQC